MKDTKNEVYISKFLSVMQAVYCVTVIYYPDAVDGKIYESVNWIKKNFITKCA